MFKFLSREHEIAQQVYQVPSCCHGDVIVDDIIITASGATVVMASTVSEDTRRKSPKTAEYTKLVYYNYYADNLNVERYKFLYFVSKNVMMSSANLKCSLL